GQEKAAAPAAEHDPAPLSGTAADASPAEDDEHWSNDGMNGEEAFTPSHGGSFDEDEYSAAQNVAEKPSLREHLMEQIHVDILEPADRFIAAALVELLDEA